MSGTPISKTGFVHAEDEMRRVLDASPASRGVTLAHAGRITPVWRHGALHGRTEPMSEIVIMTYHGQAQPIAWRSGRQQVESLTRPGTVTLIPSGHEGRWDIEGDITVSHVYIPPQRLARSAQELNLRSAPQLVDRVAVDDPITSRLLEILAIEASSSESHDAVLVAHTVDLVCHQLLRQHAQTTLPQRLHHEGRLAAWQERRMADFVDANLHRPITLDDMAAQVSLSRFHFSVMFKGSFGMPPHRWLANRRMERAKILLANPQLSITEISLMVGYAQHAAFTHAFRKQVGLSPQAFRRNR